MERCLYVVLTKMIHTVVLGDLENASIKEVWGGEKLKKYRKVHLDKEFDKIPLCKDCTCYFTWWMRK
ncbi:hypothetical protein HKBW3S44_01400 [Candidatus Hakubella thermalkaliphila]|uniref:4Fe4S-binding SPASM domain-containing protein n=1 Tax=Candidatus Hakubella thermalkaliphila TaxID=2754717 RepID=A0A6V8PZS8_9ACTN|nr:hypothetical protein HKBW3S44_01400 [Candidatus Hakubella thermalkaliphila]